MPILFLKVLSSSVKEETIYTKFFHIDTVLILLSLAASFSSTNRPRHKHVSNQKILSLGVIIVNFEHISHLFSASIVDYGQIFVSWDRDLKREISRYLLIVEILQVKLRSIELKVWHQQHIHIIFERFSNRKCKRVWSIPNLETKIKNL